MVTVQTIERHGSRAVLSTKRISLCYIPRWKGRRVVIMSPRGVESFFAHLGAHI